MTLPAPTRTRLLFVVNVDWFFVSHRLPIALEALRQGYEVHVAAVLTDQREQLQSCGLVVHPLSLRRSSMGPWAELQSFLQIVRLFRSVRPDIVHLVTVKPVVFGGIAARLTRVPAVLAAVSGLGFVFIADGAVARLRRLLVGLLYRLALGQRRLKVVFQNTSDSRTVARIAGLAASQCAIVKGSGVDLHRYRAQALPPGVPVVMMAARLLVDKGVREFVEAASLSHRAGLAARFCLVGDPDPGNPASVAAAELAAWRQQGIVELWGHRTDMAAVLAQAHIVVLPSYREGLPKVLVEAAACGRAVVTTDVPGCRDAIQDGVTGVLVPARDAHALADAVRALVSDPLRCERMGRAGRLLAEAEFDVDRVVAEHLSLYRELLA